MFVRCDCGRRVTFQRGSDNRATRANAEHALRAARWSYRLGEATLAGGLFGRPLVACRCPACTVDDAARAILDVPELRRVLDPSATMRDAFTYGAIIDGRVVEYGAE